MPVTARVPIWLPTAVLAAAAPSLLAYNVAPSATFLNQALALALWGLFAALSGLAVELSRGQRRAAHRAFVVPAALVSLLVAATLASHLWGGLPWTFALSVCGSLLAAAVLAAAGARAGAAPIAMARRVFALFCLGWMAAGMLNVAIAMLQTFAPQLADGVWVARSSLAGRAVGNLRQPNHLSMLLLWSAVATVVLLELGQLSRRAAGLVLTLLVAGLVLTASRTAVVGVLLLATWGLVDRRLGRPGRVALLAMPFVFALAWLAMAAWSRLTHEAFGGVQRLAEADLSASRLRIWADTIDLIRRHPLTGVGVGEFNFAWSLSVMPNRPVAFFDHAHNLFLHWAAEMGLPLTAVLTLLLGWGLWGIARAGLRGGVPAATLPPRASLVMLLLIGLHSQLEYPLWYAYFLLPTAWLLGYGLARAASSTAAATPVAAGSTGVWRPGGERTRSSRRLAAAGLATTVAAFAATADYARVAAVFDEDHPAPLAKRIDTGRRSLLFGHHADYAAATISAHPEREMDALRRAAHYLLDTRLMTAWAEAWAASGDLPRARYLAARLREFRNPASQRYFAACDTEATPAEPPQAAAAGEAGTPARPYQCLGPDPQVILRWSDFR